ncbi:HPP family protein [Micromonospora chaiyaphumensis]|uniref:HPP family protein n=1 Tax=Micromonospora chaiyaphumensis TaxID=307119 RepID=A0A1C4ZL15_9ACTN|nr:HPP family protein [Micromonospora chaiyaphumensis]SCF33471.1 HPP family protein [Micromonospora chaiyaphumensis]
MPPEIDETPSRPAVRALAGSAVAVVVAGAIALLTRQPWLFPSLGPAIMLHVEQPGRPESSPRNTVLGHLVALLAGYAFLVLTGLAHRPSALQEGMSGVRIVAAAGSLAVTAAVLVLLKAAHPPAGATTLIVSLGLLHTPVQLVVAFAAVLLVTAVDLLFNRATGRPMPLWAAPKEG